MNESDIELYIALGTALLSFAGTAFQLYRKVKESRDWKDIARALVTNVEIADDEFKTTWPEVEKKLEPEIGKAIKNIAGPKNIKTLMSREELRGAAKDRLNRIINQVSARA